MVKDTPYGDCVADHSIKWRPSTDNTRATSIQIAAIALVIEAVEAVEK